MHIMLGRRGWRAALLASTALLAAPDVHAQWQWTGAVSSSWFNGDNWIPTTVPSSGTATIDTMTRVAVINLTGANVSGLLSVGSSANGQLEIHSGGTLTTSAVSIGTLSGSNGHVQVLGVGAHWNNTGGGNVIVGGAGNGSLGISGGGTVTTGPAVMIVGQDTGSLGVLSVADLGSILSSSGDLVIGGVGEGRMRIENGGKVSNTAATIGAIQSSATSAVTVTGAGATWTNTGSLLIGGLGDGKGLMFVTDGGTVSSADGIIGASHFATGAVTVSGAGSTWTNSGTLVVGKVGNGTLRIEDGGKVSNAIGFIGKAGGTDSTGTVVVTGAGSSWTNSSNLLIGGDPSLGTAGQGTLVVANGGVVSSSGSSIGDTAASTGAVTVDGAGSSWTTGALRVGNPGKGTLTITDGGTVISDFDSIFVGNGKNATGTVTVSGAGSTLNSATIPLYVGVAGTGTLSISNGGRVSNTTGTIADQETSVSSATVSGPGATWTNSAGLFVGAAGDGALAISGGGTVSNTFGIIGNKETSVSTATVNGAGTTWTNSENLIVGNFGTGTLRIENGGKVSNTLGSIAQEAAGATGVVTVTGSGATWTNSAGLIVGGFGQGALAISDGGKVSAATFSIIGNRETSVSTTTVSGAGSQWTSAGDFIVGNFGTGSLRVESGGTVSNTGDGFIGRQANASGAVTVTGADATWTNSGSLTVGQAGGGTLTIANGGKVSNTFAVVGDKAGVTGMVTVSGTDSRWTNSEVLIVGDDGTGTLTINGGGSVRGVAGFIGANGSGTVTVDGAGSSWTGTDGLTVGLFGTASLAITNGGSVQSKDGIIAFAGSKTATVRVDGAGSRWTVNGDLTVGDDGIGALTIANGGAVTSTGKTTIGLLSNGVGTLAIGAGDGSTAAAPGTLQATSLTFGAGSGTLVLNHTGTDYTFAAPITGKGSIRQLAGTTVLSADSGTFAGTTAIDGGTLRVDGKLGGTVTVGTGGTLGGTGTLPGAVTVDGTLSAGASPGTLTVGTLTLNAGATSRFELNTPGIMGGSDPVTGNDLVVVSGNLTLGGGLDARTAAAGYYRLFNYGGTLAGSFATTTVTGTGGFAVASHQLETTITGEINLSVLGTGQTLQFWDGPDTAGNGIVEGGVGTWSAANTNWTGQPGQAAKNSTWSGSVGVFAGAAGGAVTVAGTQAFDTLQFSTNGYALSGGTLALSPASGTTGTITVDTGISATIGTPITDGTGNGLLKVGGGTLALTGASTYSGDTVVGAGTLALGAGGSIAASRAVRLDAAGATLDIAAGGNQTVQNPAGATGSTVTLGANTLTVASSSDTIFAGAIGGSGGLAKTGSGTLTLSAASTYSGPTTLQSGRLVVNGSIANSTVTITGGMLAGTGTIGGLIVNSGSTVAPGNSIGTMTVAGNIGFAAGSTYAVEIEPSGTSDLLHATGTATLSGGTVSVIKAPGVYTAGTRYTILSADAGVSGTFAGLTQNLPFINLALAYDPANVFLDVTRNSVAFCDVAATRNQCAAARGAESLGAGAPLTDAIASLPDAASARQAFNALSGEIHASTRTALIEDSHHLRDAVITRTRLAGITAGGAPQFAALAQASDQSQRPQDGTAITVWMQGFGALARTSGNGNAASLKRTTGGVVVGADARLDDTWTIGLATGYSRTNLDVNGRASRADIDSWHLALYGGAQFGPLGLRLGASHTWHSIDSTRRIAFPGFADSARADYKARTTQVFGDVGYALALGSVALEPFANVAWVHVSTNRFGEKGGIAALQGRSGSDSSLFSTLGVRAAAEVWNDDNKTLTLRGSLGWRHAFGDVTPAARLAFAGGTSFGIEGVPIARDAAVIEAGFDLKIGKSLTVGAGYAGVIASGARDHTFKGTITFRF